ncbi:class I SAM-dependent methyltransferase, partial [uncultured Chitinophaga sp.]|uniref:class I SAM-dependent methyltransferase n=1 Tax=uncultured Chitinophaga sp. TaxID=339340 RepID=UPI0025E49DEF
KVLEKGGPEEKEYRQLDEIFQVLSEDLRKGLLNPEEIELFHKSLFGEGMEDSLHGHCQLKPYGYAGDFMIIDKMYRQQVTDNPRFRKWDMFWNNHAAVKAVRNRKDYFIHTLRAHLQSKRPLRLLNVASGPARDLSELYAQINPASLQTTCIEADSHAIGYARELTKEYEEQVNFVHKNVFRYQDTAQYDVVWSAGLFDYFEDKLFIKLLKKLVSWAAPGGEVIVGNFNTHNPSRQYMELIGDWYLHHRSAEELTELAIQAGIDRERIHVGSEPEAINLFLHIRV